MRITPLMLRTACETAGATIMLEESGRYLTLTVRAPAGRLWIDTDTETMTEATALGPREWKDALMARMYDRVKVGTYPDPFPGLDT